MLWISLSVVPSPFARERLEAMANANSRIHGLGVGIFAHRRVQLVAVGLWRIEDSGFRDI